jgi:pyruvate/2-oxoglutarate dehydrogenase complex dihydrolipoamide acyltransferase (E2) component
MPGLVVAVPVREGDSVRRGTRLLSIEAMKMETGVFSECDGTVTEVLVTAGTQVDTKQLLMVVGDPGGAAEGPGDPEEDAGGGADDAEDGPEDAEG